MAGSMVSGQTIARTGRYKMFPIVGLGAAVDRPCCSCTASTSDTPIAVVDIYAS